MANVELRFPPFSAFGGRRFYGPLPLELVVFGDAENDLDMFHRADVRVAVRNAAPEVLALADHVAESNDEDGVIRWLIERHPAIGEHTTRSS